MDTQAFLVKRQAILDRLQASRSMALQRHQDRKRWPFGLNAGYWTELIFSLGAGAELSSWLSRVLMATVAPVLISIVREKADHFLQRKSKLKRFLEFLPLSKFGL